MENGQEKRADLELTDPERKWLRDAHAQHIKCELDKCAIHAMIHMVIRLEVARRKLEHEVEAISEGEMGTHGINGLCERCKWTPLDWVTSLSADWDGKEGGKE